MEVECEVLIGIIKLVYVEGIIIIWIEYVVYVFLVVVEKFIVIDFGKKIVEGEFKIIMNSVEVKEIYLGVDFDV